MPISCLVASIISDKKSAINLVIVSLYVMRHLFSGYFKDFLIIFGYQKFDSDVHS